MDHPDSTSNLPLAQKPSKPYKVLKRSLIVLSAATLAFTCIYLARHRIIESLVPLIYSHSLSANTQKGMNESKKTVLAANIDVEKATKAHCQVWPGKRTFSCTQSTSITFSKDTTLAEQQLTNLQSQLFTKGWGDKDGLEIWSGSVRSTEADGRFYQPAKNFDRASCMIYIERKLDNPSSATGSIECSSDIEISGFFYPDSAE